MLVIKALHLALRYSCSFIHYQHSFICRSLRASTNTIRCELPTLLWLSKPQRIIITHQIIWLPWLLPSLQTLFLRIQTVENFRLNTEFSNLILLWIPNVFLLSCGDLYRTSHKPKCHLLSQTCSRGICGDTRKFEESDHAVTPTFATWPESNLILLILHEVLVLVRRSCIYIYVIHLSFAVKHVLLCYCETTIYVPCCIQL